MDLFLIKKQLFHIKVEGMVLKFVTGLVGGIFIGILTLGNNLHFTPQFLCFMAFMLLLFFFIYRVKESIDYLTFKIDLIEKKLIQEKILR